MLSADHDAFGSALRDHLTKRTDTPPLLLEFEDGTVTPALPAQWFFQAAEHWDPLERAMLAEIAVGPVLDLGAGSGRHSLLMQARGLDITAVDVSPTAVEVCRARGVRDARVSDLAMPPNDRRWGAVLLMGGNFGLAGGWTETRRLLVRLAEVCADDAVIVADSVDPDTAQQRERRQRDPELADPDTDRGVVTFRLRYGRLVSPWARLLNVPISDLETLIKGTGWTLDRHECHGDDHYFVLRRHPDSLDQSARPTL